MPTQPYDVLIAGGGLAGLCLARQLTREAPELRVFLAEKRAHPVPEAAFKVGESSVEIGAHYFQRVLGLEPHLREHQLEKFGLRYFFPAGGNRRVEARFELGPSGFPPVPSFQLDRGRLENMLLRTDRDAGVDVRDDCRVTGFEFGASLHRLEIQSAGRTEIVEGRWLVDASGRSGLIRHRLGLTRPVGHLANACWFRVPSRLQIDDWSADPAWKARVPSGERWLSTNHLMGVGYWVWLIPLGSGSTSVGIVVDATLHPFTRLNRFDRALDWLREFEPQCADVVAPLEGALEDFLALRGFAYGCSRVYSPDRWALIGEAGLFTDPFYSPGSDFIAMGNDFVVDLIRRERAGEDVSARVEQHNTMYLRLYDAFLRVYEGQYPIMGNAQVMTAKVAWDNACYWAITALLFFQRKYTQPEFIRVDRRPDAALLRAARAHAAVPESVERHRRAGLRRRLHQRGDARMAAAAAGRARRTGGGRRGASGPPARELRAPGAVRARPPGHRAGGSRGAGGVETVPPALGGCRRRPRHRTATRRALWLSLSDDVAA